MNVGSGFSPLRYWHWGFLLCRLSNHSQKPKRMLALTFLVALAPKGDRELLGLT